MTASATATLTVRTARPSDAPALDDLAALDSARRLVGDVLLAETGGRPVAAVSVADGRVVADPFALTATSVAMLRMRAAQLRSAPGPLRPLAQRLGLRAATG